MTLLHVDGIVAGYGRIRVLRSVSLEVAQGQVVCLLGANGAGKTTTLRAISGLLPVQHGSIYFEGSRLDRESPDAIARRGIAHIPEGRGILRTLTVEENLQIGGRRLGTAYRDEVSAVLKLFPRLGERWGQRAATLSGGEQQMLAIGRSLLSKPELLMIDELSLGLAPVVLDELFPVVADIARAGVGVLLVEQFVGRAMGIADHVCVLEKGRIVVAGTPAELEDGDALQSAYLGASTDTTVS